MRDRDVDFGVSEFRYESDLEAGDAAQFPIIDASVNTAKALSCLTQSGINTIIRYYCSDPSGAWKVVKKQEANAIVNAGVKLCIVHEASSKPSYFSYASGKTDGDFACRYGEKIIGQPKGTAIYFAIDFDFDPRGTTLKNQIIPYFKGVIDAVKAAGSPYRIGVYGSGFTCRSLLDLNMVELAWLAQSTGWSEYASFKASRRWALLQKPTTHICEIEVDFDEASVDDFGAFGSLNAPASSAEDDAYLFDEIRFSSALDGLDAGFKAKVTLLINTCAAKGIKMVPYFGLRSPKEQAALWRQSRSPGEIAAGVAKLRNGGAPWLAGVLESTSSTPGPAVTNALPGMSWHQWGEALDCYREIDGKPSWDEAGYADYANIAETAAVGLTAGGHWASLKDWPHVQLRAQAGPQNIYSLPVIDAMMKERWSGSLVAIDIEPFIKEGHAAERASILTARIVDALREATQTEIMVTGEPRPYFFPNGIFKIDVALGILADPPSGSAEADSGHGISARVIISGSDKA